MKTPIDELIWRLRKRAEIRRAVRAEDDRIAADMTLAANYLDELQAENLRLQTELLLEQNATVSKKSK